MFVKLSVLGALNGGSGVIELSGAKLLAATAFGRGNMSQVERHNGLAAAQASCQTGLCSLHCVGPS